MSRIKHWLEDENGELRVPKQEELDAFYIPKLDPWSVKVEKDQHGEPIALQPREPRGVGLASLFDDITLETYPPMPAFDLPDQTFPAIGSEGIGSVAWSGVKGLASWVAKVLKWLYQVFESQSMRQFQVLSFEANRVRASLRGVPPPEGNTFLLKTHVRALSHRNRPITDLPILINHYQLTSSVAHKFFEYYYKTLLPEMRRLVSVLQAVVRQPTQVERVSSILAAATPAQLNRSILKGTQGSETTYTSAPLLSSLTLQLTTRETGELASFSHTRVKMVRETQRFSKIPSQVNFNRFGFTTAERLLKDVGSFCDNTAKLAGNTKNSEVEDLIKALEKVAQQLATVNVAPDEEKHLTEIASVVRTAVNWISTPYHGFYGSLLTMNRGCVRLCLENWRR